MTHVIVDVWGPHLWPIWLKFTQVFRTKIPWASLCCMVQYWRSRSPETLILELIASPGSGSVPNVKDNITANRCIGLGVAEVNFFPYLLVTFYVDTWRCLTSMMTLPLLDLDFELQFYPFWLSVYVFYSDISGYFFISSILAQTI